MNQFKPNPWKAIEDKAEDEIPLGALQIYEQIAKTFLNRPNQTEINRASAATMCFKRRWYQRLGVEGIPLTPRKGLNFMVGDIVEMATAYHIKTGCVGPGKLYSEVDFGKVKGKFTVQNGAEIEQYEQPEHFTDVGGIMVKGHVDGWGRNSFTGELELIEIKSAADFGYDEFKENGPGDYLKQAHVNMRSAFAIENKVNTVRFFYFKKSTGHIWDRSFGFDYGLYEKVVREYGIAMQRAEPEAPYKLQPEMVSQGRGKPKKATGRMIAGFPCSYCPYVEVCHKGIKKDFKKDWQGGMTPVFYK